MKKYKLLLVLLLQLFLINNLYSQITEAKVTVILSDKAGNLLTNLPFKYLNSDGSFYKDGLTDDKGEFVTMLLKGKTYNILFEMNNKEWKFDLSVPDKSGPKSYKFSFTVHVETKSDIVYQSKSSFDEKKDPTICAVNIAIRDESGMVLPDQKFTIEGERTHFKKEVITNSEGHLLIKLKRDDRYNLGTYIDDYKFSTYFEVSKEMDEVNFNFDIDFNIAKKTKIDTTFSFNEKTGLTPIKTIILIVNKETRQPEEGAEVILEESNNRDFSAVTDKTGQVETTTYREKVYELFVRKEGKTYKYELEMPQDATVTEYKYIAEIEYGKTAKRRFRLNAYFDTSKWDLRPESFPDLERLLKFMQENNKMVIEVEGHTDSRDTEQRNQVLSENRAMSIRVWLTERGIDGNRITYIGYGENHPTASNKTEQGRQLNRRIEVAVIDE